MNKLEKLLLLNMLFMAMIMIGAGCNTLVFKNNGGRMPVYLGYTNNFESESHFGFWDKSDVEYYYLTDIIDTPFNAIVSIGDIIMAVSGLAFITNSLFIIKELIKREKQLNTIKHLERNG